MEKTTAPSFFQDGDLVTPNDYPIRDLKTHSLQQCISFTIVLLGMSCAFLSTAIGLQSDTWPPLHQRALRAAIGLIVSAFLVSFGVFCSAHICWTYSAMRSSTLGHDNRPIRQLVILLLLTANMLAASLMCVGAAILVWLANSPKSAS